jgi:hypothetical protein
MERPYFLLINSKGRSIKVYHSHLVFGGLVLLLLLTVAVISIHSVVQIKENNTYLLNSLNTRGTEVDTLLGEQTKFESYIGNVESELSSIKQNFETYKTEVEKNVR